MAPSLDYPHMEDHSTHDHGESSPETADPVRGYAPNGHAAPGGLAVAANGLRLDPAETRFTPGTSAEWTFRIVDDDGKVVTDFEEAHGERSHLVVVRRDLTRFQHLHPELTSDGTWRVDDFALSDSGVYRAFVDVVVDGRPTTLGFDLFASGAGTGTETVAERPDSSRRATADGYDIELLTDGVVARESSRLTFEVRRDGDPVSKLDEYLGALGHLVALREGDLAYLHVHPEGTDPDSGQVAFQARFPTSGRYRLFLQTRPEGELVTTAFDVRVRQ
ncbi:FixH family protein [Haloprofundus halophilus]|uniref:FixH family protein n=1 Tax=Haloprofundus halophilus TaxID=2283527 RepID=UPI001E475531|nr:FixH family protein [Haloprofundus halophilus]